MIVDDCVCPVDMGSERPVQWPNKLEDNMQKLHATLCDRAAAYLENNLKECEVTETKLEITDLALTPGLYGVKMKGRLTVSVLHKNLIYDYHLDLNEISCYEKSIWWDEQHSCRILSDFIRKDLDL